MIEKYTGHIKFDCGENLDEFNEKKLLDNLSILNISDHQGSHFAPHCVHRSMWEKSLALVKNLILNWIRSRF